MKSTPSSRERVHEDGEIGEGDENLPCVFARRHECTFACVIFDGTDLHCVEDVAESLELDITHSVQAVFLPRRWYICRSDDPFWVRALENIVDTDGGLLIKRSLRKFKAPQGYQHYLDEFQGVRNVTLLAMSTDSAPLMLGCVIAFANLKLSEEKMPSNITIFKPAKFMSVDNATRVGLNIFSSEAHPKKVSGASREGVSLYSMMSAFCHTEASRRVLRTWFLRPLASCQEINRRLAIVSLFSTHEMGLSSRDAIRNCLKAVSPNLVKTLAKVDSLSVTSYDLKAINETARAVLSIAKIARRLIESGLNGKGNIADTPVVKLGTWAGDEVDVMVNLINDTVDFPESISQHKFIPRSNASGELVTTHELLLQMPAHLEDVARECLQNYGHLFTQCHLHFAEQCGFLICVPQNACTGHMRATLARMTSKSDVSGKEQDLNVEGLRVAYEAQECLFLKNTSCCELDDEYGKANAMLVEQEARLYITLLKVIAESSRALIEGYQYVLEIECLVAFSLAATTWNLVNPTVYDGNAGDGEQSTVINIQQGRHLMIEVLNSEMTVPNDFSTNKGHVSVVTGPNMSGKSVYLKSVGLVVFLAQIGSFVPANSSELTPMQRIVTRLHTSDAMVLSRSSFMGELHQMAHALHTCNGQTLILADEFGRGTCSDQGAALLVSVMKHIMGLPFHQRPVTLFSTHLHHAMRAMQAHPLCGTVNWLTTKVHTESDSLVYLYKVVHGECGTGYGYEAAADCEIPEPVLRRAETVAAGLDGGRLECAAAVKVHAALQQYMVVEYDKESEVIQRN
eukprot:Clim_evm80s207 gene=Clim_evmTU80s207